MEASLLIQCITMYQHVETIKYINILPGNKENGSQLTDSQKVRVEPQWTQLKANIRR